MQYSIFMTFSLPLVQTFGFILVLEDMVKLTLAFKNIILYICTPLSFYAVLCNFLKNMHEIK